MSLTVDPLAAAEASARLVESTSSFRHDVRNRLAAVKNAAFYLKRKSERTTLWTEDQRVRTFFDLIDTELLSTEALISGLTGPSTLFEAIARPLDPAAAVERALELVRLEPGHAIHFERNIVTGSSIDADPDELAVAIRCLVENAYQSCGGDATIDVRAEIRDGTFVLDITDRGPGLAAAMQSIAFRPFVTSKARHVGLGLPIALRVARKHSGSVTFVDGAFGTCVRMTLRVGA